MKDAVRAVLWALLFVAPALQGQMSAQALPGLYRERIAAPFFVLAQSFVRYLAAGLGHPALVRLQAADDVDQDLYRLSGKTTALGRASGFGRSPDRVCLPQPDSRNSE